MVQYKHNEPYYTLNLSELADDAVRVLAFEGKEQISHLFHYKLELLSEEAELDPAAILNKKATLLFSRGDEDPLPVNGIISHFEQRGRTADYVSYYAELVPKMWRLELNFQSRVFQNMNIEQMITEVLETAEFAGEDFAFKLNETYPEIEFSVQYRETDFNFVNRRLEHFGIYYYFEHRDDNDVIVFSDVNDNLPVIETEDDITYNPNKDPLSEKETISRLIYQGQVVTGKTQLKDYNYETPSKELLAESQINSDNPGIHSDYGDHFKDESEGEFQARIRDEEIVSRGTLYKGNSDCRSFHAGHKFTMNEHYREDWNQEFLITKVMSQGNQRNLFGTFPPGTKVPPTYENYFESMPVETVFRPQRLTMQPKITGVLNAKIDSAGDGSQAEVDDQGRYKVILPFDLSGNGDGEASCYIRMIQPYAGPNYGIHFPLHKDTEVLLTFIDGNPDFPVISGAVPNPETISPVTNANQTKSVIRDNFGNEIVMDATPGDEHIRLHSPHHNSGIELGRSFFGFTLSDKSSMTLGSKFEGLLGNKADVLIGNSTELQIGSSFRAFGGLDFLFSLAGSFELNLGFKSNYSRGALVEESNKDILFKATADFIVGAGDEYCMAAGTQNPDFDKNKNKNKSVIRATPDGVTLSLGEELTETGEGKGLGNWYDKKSKTDEFKDILLPGTAFGVSFGGMLVSWNHLWFEFISKAANPIAFSGFFTISIIANIVAMKLAHKYYEENLADELIEPVRHVAPPQKIWLHRDGAIGIVSTKGAEDAVDGKKGRIVLGVNEQKVGKFSDWRYYDSSKNFKDKNNISETYQYLGDGSNIIMQKEDIELRVGGIKEADVNAKIILKREEKNISIQSGTSKIWIKNDGTISIDNTGATKGKKQVQILAEKDIFLKSKSGRINLQGSKLLGKVGEVKFKNLVVKN